MAIDKRYIVNLQGKDYPLWAGILAEAHERGLRSIRTQLIQAPTDENGQTAIVKAVVEMEHPSGDGSTRTFEGYGDASPKNVSQRLATAILRFAETRAKGRALRDAVNCGDTMMEELPGDEPTAASVAAPAAAPARPAARHEPGYEETYTDGGRVYTRLSLVSYAVQAMEQAMQQGVKCEILVPHQSTNEALVAFGRAIRPKLAVVKAVAEGGKIQTAPAEIQT